MNGEIEHALQAYLDHNTSALPGIREIKIKKATPLNRGWESIIYILDLETGTQRYSKLERLILRMYPGEDAYHKSAREFAGMQQLHAVNYPVPMVHILEREESPFDKPFIIMEHIEGEIMWPLLDRSSPEEAAVLLTRFCDLFVRLHNLDWQDFVTKGEQTADNNPFHFVDQFLSGAHDALEMFPDLEIFLPVVEWLEARRDQVPCAQPAPVHWDYHPGNLILQPDGNLKVIDWTQIQVTDPRFDLGWTLLLTGAYSGKDTRTFIHEEYQRLSGREVENLAFFDVANAIKRLGSVMISLSAGADKMGMRPDAIAKMRRDFPMLRWVYNLMVKRTDIYIQEVERFLEM